MPVHVNAFGFDIYQSSLDIIDYSKYKHCNPDSYKSIKGLSSLRFKDEWSFLIIANNCSDGETVIDIGANIGMMSHYVGSSGSVYCFEPGPISHALLSRNVYVNNSPCTAPITIEKCGVSDNVGHGNLFINASGESDNQIHTFDDYSHRSEPNRVKVSVKLTTLDTYCAQHNILPSFIKIDTQGHEYYVLRGAIELISSSENISILCEFAPYLKAWEKFTIDDFFALIVSLKLRAFDVNYSLTEEIDVEFLKIH